MGSIQEEWLIYFHPRGTERYAKWIKWWKPPHGFAHCGAFKYIAKHEGSPTYRIVNMTN